MEFLTYLSIIAVLVLANVIVSFFKVKELLDFRHEWETDKHSFTVGFGIVPPEHRQVELTLGFSLVNAEISLTFWSFYFFFMWEKFQE